MGRWIDTQDARAGDEADEASSAAGAETDVDVCLVDLGELDHAQQIVHTRGQIGDAAPRQAVALAKLVRSEHLVDPGVALCPWHVLELGEELSQRGQSRYARRRRIFPCAISKLGVHVPPKLAAVRAFSHLAPARVSFLKEPRMTAVSFSCLVGPTSVPTVPPFVPAPTWPSMAAGLCDC